MIKTVMPGDYDWNDTQSVLMDVASTGIDRGQLQKRAAAGVFSDADVKPEKGHSIIHLIAMGDSEKYGANRNGDIFYREGQVVEFPEPKNEKSATIEHGNLDRAWTFEKYAKVYRDHKNSKHDKAYGKVIKAAHNDKMSRVELLISVPNEDPLWREDMEKLASGEDIPFSMSCRVPGDHCTICGNFAPTRRQYCSHLKKNMSELTKSGHRVGMINDHMVYFDISRVRVPADRIAYSLMKVANFSTISGERDEHTFDIPIIGADADESGVYAGRDIAALRKLAKIEKEIEAVGKAPCESTALSPEVMPDVPEDVLEGLGDNREDIGKVLAALSDAKISLSLKDLMKLIMGSQAGGLSGSIDLATNRLPGVFSRMCDCGTDELSESIMPMDSEGPLPEKVMRMISGLEGGMSLDDEPVRKRVTIVAIRGGRPSELKKAASVIDETAERMLEIYATYKLAWCMKQGVDSSLSRLAVLQHYV